jgi:1-acyl-sn-glycerol-3-phosphate acyltransferase
MLDLGRVLFGLPFRLRAEGLEHLPRRGGVVVVCSHATVLDPVFLTLVLPRPMTHLVKPLPPAFAVVREIYDVFGCVETGKGRETARAVRHCVDAVHAGRLMVVFPEGGVSDRGSLRPFQQGAARIALAAGCAVVPAAVCGSYAAWPAGAGMPRPGPVTVRFGPPLAPFGHRPEHDGRDVAVLTHRMRDAVTALYSPLDGHRARRKARSRRAGGWGARVPRATP